MVVEQAYLRVDDFITMILLLNSKSQVVTKY